MKTTRSGASTSVTIGVFIVGLLIGMGAIYALAPSIGLSSTATTTVAGAGTNTTVTTTVAGKGGLSGTITLGGLTSLTGDLSAYGQRSKDAQNLAISDINAWLAQSGATYKFAMDIEDTATDPTTALQKLQLMASEGEQVFVGPMTSAEVRNVITYANTNKLVLISQSSTAQDLKIANDFLFRFVPSDFAQASAAAALVYQYGVKDAVVVNRGDTWGVGLSNAFKSDYVALGGKLVGNVTYQVISSGSYDFTAQLSQINSLYTSAVSTYGAANVGIISFSFDELATLYQQSTTYPALSQTTWFGSDGTAESSTVTSTAGSAAAAVKSLSTIYAPTLSAKEANFTSRFVAAYNQHPDAYAYSAYDATWAAALAIIACGANSGACVQKTLPGVAASYFGVAGWPDLDSAGDRAIADYAIWEVVSCTTAPAGTCTSGQTYGWEQVGTWSAGTGTVTFTSKP
jgi:branched-chain amino acid transport system substrate-binding protein